MWAGLDTDGQFSLFGDLEEAVGRKKAREVRSSRDRAGWGL